MNQSTQVECATLRRFRRFPPSSLVVALSDPLYNLISYPLHPISPQTLFTRITSYPSTISPNMFRAAIRTASRSVSAQTTLRSFSTAPIAPLRTAQIGTVSFLQSRSYASAGLDKSQITARIMELLKSFEKVDGGKVGFVPDSETKAHVSCGTR